MTLLTQMSIPEGAAEARPAALAFGEFKFIPARQLLLRNGVTMRIGSRALDLLNVLVEHPGAVVSKAELIARAWPTTFVDESNLKVNISALSKVLGDKPNQARYVASVFGRGYRFVAEVTPCGAPAEIESEGAACCGDGLPAAPASVFGRDPVVAAILADFDAHPVITIAGPGGVGKTTVAVAAAHRAAESFSGGAALIDLATVHDPQFIPAAIASALGLGAGGGDVLGNVVHMLRPRRTILVIDNCEHLLPAAAAAVDRLAREVGGLRIVATSREALRIRGERILRLPGLDCDPSDRPTAAGTCGYPASGLFAMRAAERAGYTVTDADAPAVAEICRRLDGNALAIELAATQTATFPPGQILQMLDGALHLLRLGPPGAPLRQQSLLATLDWSYNLLPGREAAVLRAVSVFARDFGLAGAVAVSLLDAAEVADALSLLAAKSLLAVETTPETVRYRLLETTRAYCLERLQAAGEAPAVRRRHADHLCAVLDRAAADWTLRSAKAWGETYARLLDDLRLALAWAAGKGGDPALLVRLTVGGTLLWNHLSLMNEFTARVTRALSALPAAGLVGTATEMRLQTALAGTLMLTHGNAPGSRDAARRGLEIATRLGDTEYRLRSSRLVAGYETFAGRYAAAIGHMEDFLRIAEAEDPSAIAEGQSLMAMAEYHLGRIGRARQRLEPGFRTDLAAVPHAPLGRFQFHINIRYGCNLAILQWRSGHPDRADRTARLVVEQGLRIGHDATLCIALAVAACPISLLVGDAGAAGHHADLLDDTLRRHGIETWRPIARHFRGVLEFFEQGNRLRGLHLLEQAAAEIRATNHRQRLTFALGTLAEAQTVAGELTAAALTLGQAAAEVRRQRARWYLPELLRIDAALKTRCGRIAEAEALLLRAMAGAERIDALSWRLRAATDLARLRREEGRTLAARAVLQPVHAAFAEGFGTRDLRAAATLLTELRAA